MSLDPARADSPARWLEYARSDIALASAPLPEGALREHLCFHAQQAAEKALKAVLIAEKTEFPFTHNIQLLIDRLPAALKDRNSIAGAVALTPYAVAARYPGEYEPVSVEERDEAVRLAMTVVIWAESIIQPR